MDLPVNPPVRPMLAKALRGFDALPAGELTFEPKWDGFRCIVFRDGDEVVLGSRNDRPLTRYFPEMVEAVRRELPARCVLDGELIVATDDGTGRPQARLRHARPADPPGGQPRQHAGRPGPGQLCGVRRCWRWVTTTCAARRSTQRRARLEAALAGVAPPVHLTPVTGDRAVAHRWFERFEGAGLDGVIAKPTGDPYVEDRRVQFKLKHVRTADAVVAGFRVHKDGKGVGSLLLGLYDGDGRLHHVGVAASFTTKLRGELVERLAPYRETDIANHPWGAWVDAAAHEDGRMPGGLSRWSGGKDLSWEPLRPELVVEVAYSSMLAGRFRATTQLRRWRPDRTPETCTYEQLEEPTPMALDDVLSAADDTSS